MKSGYSIWAGMAFHDVDHRNIGCMELHAYSMDIWRLTDECYSEVLEGPIVGVEKQLGSDAKQT